MDHSEYIAKRIVQHLNERGFYGDGIKRHVGALDREYVDVLGVTFGITLKDGKLEMIIDPNEDGRDFERFKDYMARMENPGFWENPNLKRLKEQMTKYRSCIKNPQLSREPEDTHYRFRADINIKNEDNMFFAILNNIIRPIILYKTEKSFR